jgi:uncharacterized protein YhbP (UPF0306 family)
MDKRQVILAFLRSHPMATIATIDEVTMCPESALIAFVELDNLELIFETFQGTRKYNNLRRNSNVALVVGWDAQCHITLQYEGTAKLISASQAPRFRNIFLQKKTPCTEEFLLDPRVRLFRVKPRWIALSDYRGACPKVMTLDLH